ncbi:hypothetical protein [Aureimonas mangrovi]|uniref:hypothetical protein n=1 Tax=Aureimonas mangrovi TaxID=2758041 RepID=UPI00163D5D99|nr:hypothetical protein [Aureimonas mangrovi]
MSETNPVTQNPNEKLPDGEPLDPDVIVPEDDAGLEDEDEDDGDVDETSAGGLNEIGSGKRDERNII